MKDERCLSNFLPLHRLSRLPSPTSIRPTARANRLHDKAFGTARPKRSSSRFLSANSRFLQASFWVRRSRGAKPDGTLNIHIKGTTCTVVVRRAGLIATTSKEVSLRWPPDAGLRRFSDSTLRMR